MCEINISLKNMVSHTSILFLFWFVSISPYFIFQIPLELHNHDHCHYNLIMFDYICLLFEESLIFHFIFSSILSFVSLVSIDCLRYVYTCTHFYYQCMYGMRVIENDRVTNTITTPNSYQKASQRHTDDRTYERTSQTK